MENTGIQVPIWFKIIIAVACLGTVVLIAAWEIVWDWLMEHTKGPIVKTLAVTRHSPHFLLRAGRHATRAGH